MSIIKRLAKLQKADADPLKTKESFTTLHNTEARRQEHDQLLREYGFPSEQDPNAMRYQRFSEDDSNPIIHQRPPWQVNEASEMIAQINDEDAPSFKGSPKSVNRAGKKTASVSKGLIGRLIKLQEDEENDDDDEEGDEYPAEINLPEDIDQNVKGYSLELGGQAHGHQGMRRTTMENRRLNRGSALNTRGNQRRMGMMEKLLKLQKLLKTAAEVDMSGSNLGGGTNTNFGGGTHLSKPQEGSTAGTDPLPKEEEEEGEGDGGE